MMRFICADDERERHRGRSARRWVRFISNALAERACTLSPSPRLFQRFVRRCRPSSGGIPSRACCRPAWPWRGTRSGSRRCRRSTCPAPPPSPRSCSASWQRGTRRPSPCWWWPRWRDSSWRPSGRKSRSRDGTVPRDPRASHERAPSSPGPWPSTAGSSPRIPMMRERCSRSGT